MNNFNWIVAIALAGQLRSLIENGINEFIPLCFPAKFDILPLIFSVFGFMKYLCSGSNLSGIKESGSYHSKGSLWKVLNIILNNESFGIGTSLYEISSVAVKWRVPSIGQSRRSDSFITFVKYDIDWSFSTKSVELFLLK